MFKEEVFLEKKVISVVLVNIPTLRPKYLDYPHMRLDFERLFHFEHALLVLRERCTLPNAFSNILNK